MNSRIVVAILIAFYSAISIPSCKYLQKVDEFDTIPSELYKRIVYSSKCNTILYSSNSINYFQPFKIDSFNLKSSNKKVLLNVYKDRNFYVRDISCDCKTIALLAEDQINRKFDVFLLNLEKNKLSNLTKNRAFGNDEPQFSPASSQLAFISKFKLQIYDYYTGKNLQVSNPSNIYFKNIIWSVSGKFIYLQDSDASIWRFNVATGFFNLIWKSPEEFEESRMMTPAESNDKELFFVSDHESSFKQIYKLDSTNNVEIFVNSNEDKFLFQRPISERNFRFRSSVEGRYILKRLEENGKLIIEEPSNGVLYDFVPLEQNEGVLLYADTKHPASIFLKRMNGMLENLTEDSYVIPFPEPKLLRNRLGMYNLIFLPKTSPKKWVVWIHGGPFEQTSIRYNTYIHSLLKEEIAVIALNYPGSTGIGNAYEFRNLDKDSLLRLQLKVSMEDLLIIRNEFDIKSPMALIGISYGAKVAHHLASLDRNLFSHLIDFSGIENSYSRLQIPILYIYGRNDFAIGIANRINMIDSDMNSGFGRELVFKNEGHVISKKRNISLSTKAIKEILADSK